MKEIQKKALRPKTLIGSEQTCSHISVQPLKGFDKELEEAERKIQWRWLALFGDLRCNYMKTRQEQEARTRRHRKGIDVARW